MTLTFKFERETKNTHRFTEVVEPGKAPIVGTLYLQKAALPGVTDATELTVKIEVQ